MAEKLQRENILRMRIGDAAVDFRWLNVGRNFRWLPMKELHLERPSDTIKVTAVQFGGGGLSHLLAICLTTSLIEPKQPQQPPKQSCCRSGFSRE